ncbi:MAG TPA: hypothetical protein VFZ78_03635 [Flavisolibacter sp.]
MIKTNYGQAGRYIDLFAPAIIGMLLFVYIVIRAIVIPVTHDEVQTCLYFSQMPVWDIIAYRDPIPNNHILNTLLVKLFVSISGWHELSIRLPNILGFMVYFGFAMGVIRMISKHFLVTLFCMAALFFNPYFLEFFSLARGYALSTAFMMASVFYLLRFMKDPSPGRLGAATASGMLATYTNFTALNYFVAFIMIAGVLITSSRQAKARKRQQVAVLVAGTGLLALATWLPVSRMVATDQFIYWGQSGFYEDTIKSMWVAFALHPDHFHIPYYILTIAALLVIMIPLLFILPAWIRSRPVTRKEYQLLYLLPLATVAVNVLQHYLVQTPFLTGRTALLFFPLYGLACAGAAQISWDRFRRAAAGVMIVFIAVTGWHLAASANLKRSFEWWFDENTKDVISYLEQQQPENPAPSVTLNAHWWFTPSLEYYRVTTPLPWLQLAPYHKEPQPDSPYLFYYATDYDLPVLGKNYETVKSFGWNSRFLMKRRQP